MSDIGSGEWYRLIKPLDDFLDYIRHGFAFV